MKNTSIRVCVDATACQTHSSRNRGIGNYTAGLLGAIAKLKGERDDAFIVGLQHPESVREIHATTKNLIPSHRIKTVKVPQGNLFENPATSVVPHMQAATLARAYSKTAPQVVHVSSYFETELHLPPPSLCPGLVKTAVIYDFIPYIFKERYLPGNEILGWYGSRVNALMQCDCLFAISECTRRDAINHLDLAPEKIVTIYGACGEQFSPGVLTEDERTRILHKYEITRPFMMYTGGFDWRKNIEGAMEAFAKLPHATRAVHCLVIVCKVLDSEKNKLRKLATRIGLSESDLIITGFVPDSDLLALYRTCKAFIFPSIYEGMGLPILEAASCGAPVIAANNSSLPEMMPVKDALFDAQNTDEISSKMNEVLTDASFRETLRRQGLKHATTFTWERSAQRVIDCWREAVSKKQTTTSITMPHPRPKLAFCTPLPPEQTGIATFSSQLIRYLAVHYEIEIFTTALQVDEPWLIANHPIHQLQTLDAIGHKFDLIMYQFGNSEFHAPMIDLLRRWPGIVELHDFFLSSLLLHKHPDLFRRELLYSHGFAPYQQTASNDGIWRAVQAYPANSFIFEHALGVIVHSQHAVDLIAKFYPEGVAAPVSLIPHIKRATPPQTETELHSVRNALNIKTEEFVICSFGHVAPTKNPGLIISAFATFIKMNPLAKARLVFAGELGSGSFANGIRAQIDSLRLNKHVTVTGYLTDEDYDRWVTACNFAVQLRTNSRGETSGAMLDCLSKGTPVVFNKHGSFCEYPDNVALALDEDVSQETLAGAFSLLFQNPDLRARIGVQARQHIKENFDPKKLALNYYETMQKMLAVSAGGGTRRLIGRVASRNAMNEDLSPWLIGMASTDVVLRPKRSYAYAADFTKSEWVEYYKKAQIADIDDVWPVTWAQDEGTLKTCRFNADGLCEITGININTQNGDELFLSKDECQKNKVFLDQLENRGVVIQKTQP
ncbi:glycosyltransferase involved in cell wall biosynthesis [Ereboglobus sp. PH5-5]|uniref:glycosyltransferase n=1 Tax=Ereboglobus sp. PH5-5 TaxID=2940529 RepID=UPI002405BB34|nr:glycosyltransferase [Ereboglobus sp. PH5-5]MDF9832401.1 glycosyltransferase involved in cell wall biosynthesis [Ereboglobus sp. PH5-5]